MWLRKGGVELLNFNLVNLCPVTEMATNEILSRIKANAITSEEMIKKLKLEVMNYFECCALKMLYMCTFLVLHVLLIIDLRLINGAECRCKKL
jgi:hypothetical protein